ncbi:MAG: type VI secretion system tip protein VgrG, partial [Deltaproteobacteria bacterium]|nr:type VI secretion system tip protein VgrG [Deltaproteobacteria bacterium]
MEFKFELTFEGGESSLDVRSFDAHEELSTPFEVNVLARSPKHDIDLEGIVGKPASLVVRNANPHVAATERCWEGICSLIEHTKAEEESGVVGLSTYWLRIVPRMWLMTRNREHRIFQRKTIVEVVKRVLLEWDIKPKLELMEEYKQLDYLVQYGESDFDFACRLLERAGITYYFDFAGDKTGELTLNDQPHAAAPRPAITYNPKVSARVASENISKVRVAERVAPGSFAIRDYDFL